MTLRIKCKQCDFNLYFKYIPIGKSIIFIDISQILKVVQAVGMYLNMMSQTIVFNKIYRKQFFDDVYNTNFNLILEGHKNTPNYLQDNKIGLMSVASSLDG